MKSNITDVFDLYKLFFYIDKNMSKKKFKRTVTTSKIIYFQQEVLHLKSHVEYLSIFY